MKDIIAKYNISLGEATWRAGNRMAANAMRQGSRAAFLLCRATAAVGMALVEWYSPREECQCAECQSKGAAN